MTQHKFQEAKDFVLGLFLLFVIILGFVLYTFLGLISPYHNDYTPSCIVTHKNHTVTKC